MFLYLLNYKIWGHATQDQNQGRPPSTQWRMALAHGCKKFFWEKFLGF